MNTPEPAGGQAAADRRRGQARLRAVTATVGVAGLVGAGAAMLTLPGPAHAGAATRSSAGSSSGSSKSTGSPANSPASAGSGSASPGSSGSSSGTSSGSSSSSGSSGSGVWPAQGARQTTSGGS